MKKLLSILTILSVLLITVSTAEAATKSSAKASKATKTVAKTAKTTAAAPAKTTAADTATAVQRDIPYRDRAIEMNSSDYALSLPDRTYIPGTDFKREESTTTYTDATGTHTETTYRELDIRNNKYDLLFSDTKPEFRRFLYQKGDAKVIDEVPETNTYKASAETTTQKSTDDGMSKAAYTATDYNSGIDLKLILNDKKSSKTILFPQK